MSSISFDFVKVLVIVGIGVGSSNIHGSDPVFSIANVFTDLHAWFFFFKDTAPPEIYTLPLHDPLPICLCVEKKEQELRLAGAARVPFVSKIARTGARHDMQRGSRRAQPVARVGKCSTRGLIPECR